MRTLPDRDLKDLDHIVPSRDLSYVDPPKANYTYRQALRTETQPMPPQNPLATRGLIRAHRIHGFRNLVLVWDPWGQRDL